MSRRRRAPRVLVATSWLVVMTSACGGVGPPDPTPASSTGPSGITGASFRAAPRGPAEEKVDANLLADVRSPGAQGERLVDVATPAPAAVAVAVGELGGRLVGPAGDDTLRAWLPVSSVERIGLRADVRTVKPASRPTTS